MNISPETVHFHLKGIFNKLEVHDQVEAQYKLWGLGGGQEMANSGQRGLAGAVPGRRKTSYPFWVGDGDAGNA
jgi:hypothetical protein